MLRPLVCSARWQTRASSSWARCSWGPMRSRCSEICSASDGRSCTHARRTSTSRRALRVDLITPAKTNSRDPDPKNSKPSFGVLAFWRFGVLPLSPSDLPIYLPTSETRRRGERGNAKTPNRQRKFCGRKSGEVSEITQLLANSREPDPKNFKPSFGEFGLLAFCPSLLDVGDVGVGDDAAGGRAESGRAEAYVLRAREGEGIRTGRRCGCRLRRHRRLCPGP
jgi:hypothetical protein